MPRLLAALAAVLLVAGCDSSDPDTFRVTDYVGTYTGAVTTSFSTPDTTVTAVTALTVSVAVPAGGNTVVVTMTPAGSAPVVFNGTYDTNGAVFPVPNSTLVVRVAANGAISGAGTVPFFDLGLQATTTGSITSARFLLTANVTVVQGNAEVPAGATGVITFEALRSSVGG